MSNLKHGISTLTRLFTLLSLAATLRDDSVFRAEIEDKEAGMSAAAEAVHGSDELSVFIQEAADANGCDTGEILDAASCQRAATSLDLEYYASKKDESFPNGCFESQSYVFFNYHDQFGELVYQGFIDEISANHTCHVCFFSALTGELNGDTVVNQGWLNRGARLFDSNHEQRAAADKSLAQTKARRLRVAS